MATMVKLIPKDLSEDAALYMVILYAGSMVEYNNVGYNSIATNAIIKAIDKAEKKNAILKRRLLVNLGIFAILKKVSTGNINSMGVVLKSSLKCGI